MLSVNVATQNFVTTLTYFGTNEEMHHINEETGKKYFLGKSIKILFREKYFLGNIFRGKICFYCHFSNASTLFRRLDGQYYCLVSTRNSKMPCWKECFDDSILKNWEWCHMIFENWSKLTYLLDMICTHIRNEVFTTKKSYRQAWLIIWRIW